jgi:hypothetical protein
MMHPRIDDLMNCVADNGSPAVVAAAAAVAAVASLCLLSVLFILFQVI